MLDASIPCGFSFQRVRANNSRSLPLIEFDIRLSGQKCRECRGRGTCGRRVSIGRTLLLASRFGQYHREKLHPSGSAVCHGGIIELVADEYPLLEIYAGNPSKMNIETKMAHIFDKDVILC